MGEGIVRKKIVDKLSVLCRSVCIKGEKKMENCAQTMFLCRDVQRTGKLHCNRNTVAV